MATSDHGGDESSASPPEQHVYQDGWSSLSKAQIVDRIKGTIYGQAIGDAIGLATEFLTKEQSKAYYGPAGPTGYDAIIQDFHRSRLVSVVRL
jgi:hypothetical protein